MTHAGECQPVHMTGLCSSKIRAIQDRDHEIAVKSKADGTNPLYVNS